jgi:peptidoglycan/LPS O-acetylase OafA/YrhL
LSKIRSAEQGSPVQSGDRIDVLDGLRGVAVVAVIGYHYFSRWAIPQNVSNLYPYGAVLAELPCFRFGYLGVFLFFLVSGFVISMTLTRCKTSREFFIRRFARLVPPMILAASATFVVVKFLPPHFWTVKACDFLPSLTFTDPVIYRRVLGLDCEFIDDAYWSLFVEIRFYVWAALLYFSMRREAFLRNSALLMNASLAVLALELVVGHLPGRAIAEGLLFPQFSPWLFSGVAFFFIWRDRSSITAWLMVFEGLTANIAYSITTVGGAEWMCVVGIYALFLGLSLHTNALRFLGARWLVRVGAASYTLYLLHQNIGVTTIAALAATLGLTGRWSIGVAIFIALGLAIASIAIYDNYEVPARRYVTRWGRQLLGIQRPTARGQPTERNNA